MLKLTPKLGEVKLDIQFVIHLVKAVTSSLLEKKRILPLFSCLLCGVL